MFAIFDAFLIRLLWDKFGLSERNYVYSEKFTTVYSDLPQFCTQFCFVFYNIAV